MSLTPGISDTKMFDYDKQVYINILFYVWIRALVSCLRWQLYLHLFFKMSPRIRISYLCQATKLLIFFFFISPIKIEKSVPKRWHISSRNNQHYALNCTTPLFYILALTCFGSSLPSLGSFLDPSESFKIQIEWVVRVYHIVCGYVACVPECHGSFRNHDTPAHRQRNQTL
jgi:hypothetical protein